MLDLAFKNISRQRTRTLLTIIGIIIGIAAIVSLGSISEGINTYIQGSMELTAGKIMVQQKGSGGYMTGFSGSDLTDEQLDSIKDLSGVKDVAPMNLYFQGGFAEFGGESQIYVVGIDPEKSEYFTGENVELYDGRIIEKGESDVVTIGKTIADSNDYTVGDYVTVKEKEFEIVGIIEELENAQIDSSIVANIEDVQDLQDIDTYQLIYVVPEDIRDSERIAEDVEDIDENLEAITSVDLARQAGEMIGQIRLFTFGIGGIAAVVGGLGVLNTMIMAVLERRREFGVLKAIGATRRFILTQILTEASMISLLGGVVGVILGLIGSVGMAALFGGGLVPIVTPALIGGSLIFALMLGLIGGIYPAQKATNIDPVEALRYE